MERIHLNYLDDILKRKGISKLRLSRDTGISYDTINKYSAKTTNPSLNYVFIIAEYLEVSITELVFGVKELPPNIETDLDNDEYLLIAWYRNLTGEERREFMKELINRKKVISSDEK